MIVESMTSSIWDDKQVFILANGSRWQQSKYKYKYRPKARIWKEGSKYFLEVDYLPDLELVKID